MNRSSIAWSIMDAARRDIRESYVEIVYAYLSERSNALSNMWTRISCFE